MGNSNELFKMVSKRGKNYTSTSHCLLPAVIAVRDTYRPTELSNFYTVSISDIDVIVVVRVLVCIVLQII